jgi:hypothetical protein
MRRCSLFSAVIIVSCAVGCSSSNNPAPAGTAGSAVITNPTATAGAAGAFKAGGAGSVAAAGSGVAGRSVAGSAGSATAGAAGMIPPSGAAGAAAGSGGARGGAGMLAAGGAGGASAGAGGAAGGGAAAAGNALTGTLGALGPAKPFVAAFAITNGPETLIYLSSAPLTCAQMMMGGVKWLSTLPAGSQVIEIVIPGMASAKSYMVGSFAAEVHYAEGSKSSSTEATASTGTVTFTKAAPNMVHEGMVTATFPMGMLMGTFHAEWCTGGTEF